MMKVMRSQKKIVVIGGGTGIFSALWGLKKDFKNITAVVTMADDGGSTGILREEFGILPPGDVRRALVALAASNNETLSKLFNYRFEEGGGLAGHNFGNLLLTALERVTGRFDLAIEEAGNILSIEGRVFPVTLKRTRLIAKLANGQIIKQETNIDIPKHDGNVSIENVWLDPVAEINPAAKKAILEAEAILIGPGDLYTSIIPNLLVQGVTEALKKSRGKKIYFVNLMTKFGETTGFRASDFLRILEKYLGRKILDYAVINKTKPNALRLRPYVAEKADFVEIDSENFGPKPLPIITDLVRPTGFIRHDPEKISRLIKNIL